MVTLGSLSYQEMDPVHLQTSWPSWAKSSRLPGTWTCRTLKDLDLATLAVSARHPVAALSDLSSGPTSAMA